MSRPLRLTVLALVAAALLAAPADAQRRKKKAGAASRPAPCRSDRDEIVPLHYPDAGQVWIPREVACGGRAEVVILLHGNQGSRDPAPSIGGGRHLERMTRSLMGAGSVRPIVLAEPVHYSSCGGGGDLYGGRMSFAEYKKRLYRLLGARKIRPGSISVIGHSGAGCCPGGGVFKAAEQIRPLRLLATSDTCYHSGAYSKRLHELLGRGTVYLNISRGEPSYDHYKAFEAEMLGKKPRPFKPCDKTLYRRCVKHPGRPWFSYTTKRGDVGYHDHTPRLALRTALLRYFTGRKGAKAAPKHEDPPAGPPAPPPDLMGPPAPPPATPSAGP
ncbi:MAG TPA: hypothetical protein VGQ83_02655 [Polyangia bacterium]